MLLVEAEMDQLLLTIPGSPDRFVGKVQESVMDPRAGGTYLGVQPPKQIQGRRKCNICKKEEEF